MRTPHTFQIGSTTYTTREYCNARGITDNATILKIQWRINTYIRNHTLQQTIEELDRLTLHPTHTKHSRAGVTRDNTESGIRPWLGTKQERIIAQREKEAAASKMITQQQNGETATKAIDQQELLKQSEWMEQEQKIKAIYEAGDIENAIHQLAQVLRNATRLRKELESNQELIEYWKEITANLLNAETSNDRFRRHNRPEKNWPDV
jgi:hypothetical protein